MSFAPIELKIVSSVAVSAILRESDPQKIKATLAQLSSDSNLFDGDMCVIDVASLSEHESLPWHAYRELLRERGLLAVAVRHADPAAYLAIRSAGLVVEVGAPRPEQKDTIEAPAAAVAPPATRVAPLVIDKAVRAGQQIYAKGTDLIITAAVNSGAQIAADGNIHVYGPLRGRALAGGGSNPDARIFALEMEAELVSIAGIYRTFESGVPSELRHKACEVSLQGEALNVRCLHTS